MQRLILSSYFSHYLFSPKQISKSVQICYQHRFVYNLCCTTKSVHLMCVCLCVWMCVWTIQKIRSENRLGKHNHAMIWVNSFCHKRVCVCVLFFLYQYADSVMAIKKMSSLFRSISGRGANQKYSNAKMNEKCPTLSTKSNKITSTSIYICVSEKEIVPWNLFENNLNLLMAW